MALGKDTSKIELKGGGAIYFNTDLAETELPAAAGGSPTTPWDEMGYLAEEGTKLTDNSDTLDIRDETGELILSKDQNRVVTIETSLLQSGKEEIDYLNDNRETDLQCYYEVPTQDAGVTQQWLFPKVRITPHIEAQFGNALRTVPISIRVLKKDSSTDYYTITEV